MKKTSLGLKKPEGTDLVNIQDMNDNMDVIEKELKVRVKTTGDIKDTTVTFTQESTRANIATGEKMSAIMGKIKKFFADLTAPAFAQMITTKADLMATKATGYVPDAKAVADAVSEVNGKLNKKFYYAEENPTYVSMSGTKLLTTVKIPKPGKFLIVWNMNLSTDSSVDFTMVGMSVSKTNAFDDTRGSYVTALCKSGRNDPPTSAFGVKYFELIEDEANLYVYGKSDKNVRLYPQIRVIEL